MWFRADLKNRAKEMLKKDYWKAFLISLVIIFAGGGGGSGVGGGSNNSFKNNTDDIPWNGISDIDWSVIIPFIIIFSIIFIAIIVFSLAIRIFAGYPLEVGGRRYYVMTVTENNNKGCFSYAFNSERYMKIVSGMLLRGVYNFLWYLLLIIPGIIKSYEYKMVPYILAQNPAIGSKRAIELSRNMTMGHKFNIFILELSFLGWWLLGILACFVGVLFVHPYVDMTMAELYIDLRKEALDRGICSAEELNMDATV